MTTYLIQSRRGTAAQWATANPILAISERGFETDTKRWKTGDGATTWNSLPYDVDKSDTPQRDVPVAVGSLVNRTKAVQITTAGTHRTPHYIAAACTNLRLVYTNFLTAYPYDGAGEITAADLPIAVGLEVNGTIYRATFNGQTNITINAFGVTVSDPIGVDIPAGTWVYVRTYTSSTNYYADHQAILAGSGGFTATTDLTAPGSAAIADSINYLLGPAAVLGTPLSRIPTVLGVGDSIMGAIGDQFYPPQEFNTTYSNGGRGGFLGRGAKNYGFGSINVGCGGELASQWNTVNRARRMGFARYCRTALVNYGVNDLAGGASVATVQASLIMLWSTLGAIGLRVFQNNILPQTTSTDQWRTTGNQTVKSWEANRLALNAWLRDGAPMVNGAAVAVGTAGAVRARYFQGNTVVGAASGAHPLYGTVEVADAAESSRDSGKWKLPYSSRTVTDAVVTAASTTVTSATGNFTTPDIGKFAIINGAGAAGAVYTGTVNSAALTSTQIKVYLAPSTSVNPATMTLLDAVTRDGAHPDPMLHEEIATKLPYLHFV
ncbi:hyaluronate lyase N-terminal domain-containing protein [Mycolicibacterium llatzerense]|uniref:hyaluronate lyase N-terminal domain-containing protein n=1 Tax=Mycolicibacterium llatzerense TaxID=280871 RepID=UPI0021B687DD|nr:hypothetical protein [Mycolicibacterium llatzerense]MCT7366517.1 hypothetical protein [Mycolicibacterium llatzerense]